jgi:hypothetical protein
MNQFLGLLRVLAVIATGAGQSPVALAAEQFHSGTLKWLYPLGSGDFVIGFHADTAACPSTYSPKYMHVVVGQNGVTSDGAKRSTLLQCWRLAHPSELSSRLMTQRPTATSIG